MEKSFFNFGNVIFFSKFRSQSFDSGGRRKRAKFEMILHVMLIFLLNSFDENMLCCEYVARFSYKLTMSEFRTLTYF